jgi:hypothetical protein
MVMILRVVGTDTPKLRSSSRNCVMVPLVTWRSVLPQMPLSKKRKAWRALPELGVPRLLAEKNQLCHATMANPIISGLVAMYLSNFSLSEQ